MTRLDLAEERVLAHLHDANLASENLRSCAPFASRLQFRCFNPETGVVPGAFTDCILDVFWLAWSDGDAFHL